MVKNYFKVFLGANHTVVTAHESSDASMGYSSHRCKCDTVNVKIVPHILGHAGPPEDNHEFSVCCYNPGESIAGKIVAII